MDSFKKYYYTVSNENFVLFLRESEFRRNINLIILNERWKNIQPSKLGEKLKITIFNSDELLEIVKKFNLISINLNNYYMILKIKIKNY